MGELPPVEPGARVTGDRAHPVATFATALMLLTRLPVPRSTPHEAAALGASTVWFPVVGGMVGVIAGATYLASVTLFPPLLSAVLASSAATIVTGALHEDALADSADGFGGGRSADRVLEIMKDSRIGSFGAMALVLGVLVRVAAVVAVSARGDLATARAFVAAHVLARWSSVPLLWRLPYVRGPGGMGAPLQGRVTALRVALATAVACAMVGAAAPARAPAVLLFAVVVTCASGAYYRRRIGGLTGDCLGATNQLVEIVVYLVLAAGGVRW
jgi:adenosylcobinamide-GDP ribazoletransferase